MCVCANTCSERSDTTSFSSSRMSTVASPPGMVTCEIPSSCCCKRLFSTFLLVTQIIAPVVYTIVGEEDHRVLATWSSI